MQTLTPEGHRIVEGIAERHGVSLDAALALLSAMREGGGAQAQFHHPELGGMGQWSHGGMLMIGDMFNQDLKSRVGSLCNDLADYLRRQPSTLSPSHPNDGSESSLFGAGSSRGADWWPPELGRPASAGAQNDLRYAYFPGPRRLAIQQGGRISVYDSGEHRISGVSQAQSGDQTLSFTSQLGRVRVDDLALVGSPASGKPHAAEPETPREAEAWPPSTQLSGDAIFAAIERLADLRQKNILGEEEFAAKKRELLSRL